MKKLLTILIVFVLSGCMFAFAGCNSNKGTEGLVYNISSDGTYAEVIAYKGIDENVVIAEKYNGKPVQIITQGAFSYHNYIKNIEIPDTIKSIEDGAFEGCDSLIYTIQDGIKYLGNIKNPYLYLAKGMDSYVVNIDARCKVIGSSAFAGCNELTTITIPEGVTTIDIKAFACCRSLTSITLPNSLTTIGNRAFLLCNKLTSITLPNSLTSIGHFAFNHCYSLTSIVIPNNVISIGNYAFQECSSLTSVVIPNNVKTIGGWAFDNCSSLNMYCESDSQPSDWASNWNYSNCPVTWGIYRDNNGVLYSLANNGVNFEVRGLLNNTNTEIVIPTTFKGKSVTSIMAYAFEYCSSLTSVTIGDSVTSIGEKAFNGCISLTSIEIPNSVISIDDYAFYGCVELGRIVIPESVTSIGLDAFANCDNLIQATFIDTETWYITEDITEYQNKTGGKQISVIGDSTNAYNLKTSSIYRKYYWYKI